MVLTLGIPDSSTPLTERNSTPVPIRPARLRVGAGVSIALSTIIVSQAVVAMGGRPHFPEAARCLVLHLIGLRYVVSTQRARSA